MHWHVETALPSYFHWAECSLSRGHLAGIVGPEAERIRPCMTIAVGGEAAGDTNTEVENLVGSVHDDTLTGDDGVNSIQGGAGADTIDGGGGNDQVFAGDGDDTINGDAGNDNLKGFADQGNRASEALDEGFEELIAPACLFELSAV